MKEKLSWRRLQEGKYRSAVGTIQRRATGWFFYLRGVRLADGGPFPTLAQAKRYADR